MRQVCSQICCCPGKPDLLEPDFGQIRLHAVEGSSDADDLPARDIIDSRGVRGQDQPTRILWGNARQPLHQAMQDLTAAGPLLPPKPTVERQAHVAAHQARTSQEIAAPIAAPTATSST